MITNAWEVYLLFLIPFAGGAPAGVILAKNRGFEWPAMILLYIASDVTLACIFEPLMLMIANAGRRSPKLQQFNEAMKTSLKKSSSRYGVNPRPLTLILISFGVDPMTGRTAAFFAGHGFITGWTLAIIGDVFFFSVIMGSTLWLNNVLGDGTWAAVIVMIVMMLIPPLFRRLRDSIRDASN